MVIKKAGSVLVLFSLVLLTTIHTLIAEQREKNNIDNQEKIYVKKIIIKGNTRTRTEIIKDRITIREKEIYPLDTIVDEINNSRNNILSTGLFSDVYFDDVFDDNGNLELYVEVTEKRFLNITPSGFIYLDKNQTHFHNSLYFKDVNFRGNKSILQTIVYIYDSPGVELGYSSSYLKPFKINVYSGYINSTHYSNVSYYISPTAVYDISRKLNLSFSIEFGKAGDFYMALGTPVSFNKAKDELKNSFSINFIPQLILNRNNESGYLIIFEGRYTKKLMLQIKNMVYGEMAFSQGRIPDRKKIISRARGYDPFNYTGNFRFSVTEELSMPFIFNYDIELGLFFDGDIIGDIPGDPQSTNPSKFLIGGGISFRWYHSILNPLRIDLALGKGLMINFSERF